MQVSTSQNKGLGSPPLLSPANGVSPTLGTGTASSPSPTMGTGAFALTETIVADHHSTEHHHHHHHNRYEDESAACKRTHFANWKDETKNRCIMRYERERYMLQAAASARITMMKEVKGIMNLVVFDAWKSYAFERIDSREAYRKKKEEQAAAEKRERLADERRKSYAPDQNYYIGKKASLGFNSFKRGKRDSMGAPPSLLPPGRIAQIKQQRNSQRSSTAPPVLSAVINNEEVVQHQHAVSCRLCKLPDHHIMSITTQQKERAEKQKKRDALERKKEIQRDGSEQSISYEDAVVKKLMAYTDNDFGIKSPRVITSGPETNYHNNNTNGGGGRSYPKSPRKNRVMSREVWMEQQTRIDRMYKGRSTTDVGNGYNNDDENNDENYSEADGPSSRRDRVGPVLSLALLRREQNQVIEHFDRLTVPINRSMNIS
jgi:hypothetical protein